MNVFAWKNGGYPSHFYEQLFYYNSLYVIQINILQNTKSNKGSMWYQSHKFVSRWIFSQNSYKVTRMAYNLICKVYYILGSNYRLFISSSGPGISSKSLIQSCNTLLACSKDRKIRKIILKIS